MSDPRPTPSGSELWRCVRDDYVAGLPAAVVAERYGVSQRTLQRRAAAEGWRRCDRTVRVEPASWRRGFLDARTAAVRHPEFAEIEEANSIDAAVLLFAPDQSHLRLFAFRRAAEAAAMGRPSEAVVWMRLVHSLDRSGDRIDEELAPMREIDLLRTALLRRAGIPDPSPTADDAGATEAD